MTLTLTKRLLGEDEKVPKGSALRLIVEGAEEAQVLKMGGGAEASFFWEGALKTQEIRGVLDELRVKLTEMHDTAGDELDLDRDSCERAVNKLLILSLSVGYGLFGQRPDELYREARARAPGAFNPSIGPRVVEICTPSTFSYPIELLRWQDTPEDLSTPALQIRALMGMSSVITRRFSGIAGGSGGNLRNAPKLPVTVFRHPGLSAASQEVDYFRQVASLIDLYGPWPGIDPLPFRAVSRHVLDSNVGVDGLRRSEPVAVIHLACHCNTEGTADNLHYFDVGGGENGRVELGELKRGVFQERPNRQVPRALIFLNACGTAAPQMADRSSFTTFLLEKGFPGVLGTLCDISDTVASHFAVVFYEALLGGSTVGEAMYAARWHLMDRHRNPLGLLYTYYGDPDLRISRPALGEVLPACSAPAIRW